MDKNRLPHCTIDFPLEFSSEEITANTPSINTLLKCNYLIGSSLDFDGALQSIFDIAVEIAEVDCCAFISGSPDADDFTVAAGHHPPNGRKVDPRLFLPAALARHFDKGIHLDGDKDPRFAEACQGWNATSLVVFPLRRDMEFIGALLFGRRDARSFSPVQVKNLWVLAGQAEYLVLQRDAARTFFYYSFLDPSTHLYNRRYFDGQLEREIFRSRRTGKPVSLLLLDLDDFRKYNDAFLPSAGDIALQEIAAILRDSAREVDTVARLGDDEFAVLLVESASDGARGLANRIGERIGRHLLPGKESARTEKLTASIGVATFPSDSIDRQDLVHKADHALQTSKSQGGGKVMLYQDVADLVSLGSDAFEIPIQKIYDAARSVVDTDKFLEILLFTAMRGSSSGRGSIVAASPGGNFTFRAAIGFGNEEERFSPGTTVSPGPVTSWVSENKEPLLVTGEMDMPLGIRGKRNGYRSGSFLSIPLLKRGDLLGILHLTDKTGNRSFHRDDLEALLPVSEEIAGILLQGSSFRETVRMFSTSVLASLSGALEMRYAFLRGHGRRVQELSVRIGKRLGLKDEELSTVGTAALLHDIGIVGIPGDILSKSQRLTDRELEISRKHPFIGAKMLDGIPGMEKEKRVILEHQEFFNGSGYPHGLRGEEISLGARIVSLAEYYDSITSSRPHRGKLRHEEALQLLRNSRNTLFEDRICDAFFEEMGSAAADGTNRAN